jgi:Flp pilus assembly protein TadG
MMRVGAARHRKTQGGAVIVEAVVVTPFLLLLILAAAEITNAFVEHNTLTKAVRAGARHAAGNAIVGTTGLVALSPQLVSETRNLVVYGNTAGTGTPVLTGFAPGTIQVQDLGGNDIQVTASYAYTGILGATLPSFGFGSSHDLTPTLRATVVMRAL